MPASGYLSVKPSSHDRRSSIGEFVRFLATGGGGAICNVCSRMLLSRFVRFEVAITFSYLIGLVVAFLLARAFVFAARDQPWQGGLIKFAAVNTISFTMVWLVSVFLLRHGLPYLGVHWHPELVAHVIGVASPTVFSYYAHKFFTFRAV